MTRLGINVQDALLDRLKPFKGSINVSQVCRDALETQVTACERATSRIADSDLSDLIGRFRQEHAAREIDWEGLGQEDAKVWTELASLKDFETLFYRLGFVGRPGTLKRPSIDIVPWIEGTRRFADRSNEHEEWFQMKYEHDEGTNYVEQATTAYELGWFSYVRAVWGRVQEAIAEDVRSATIRNRRALEDIAPPRHLTDH